MLLVHIAITNRILDLFKSFHAILRDTSEPLSHCTGILSIHVFVYEFILLVWLICSLFSFFIRPLRYHIYVFTTMCMWGEMVWAGEREVSLNTNKEQKLNYFFPIFRLIIYCLTVSYLYYFTTVSAFYWHCLILWRRDEKQANANSLFDL